MDSRCMPCLCTGRAAPPCDISECRCDDDVAKLASRSCERQVLRRSKKENWGKTSDREIECLLNDNHQKGKMMIMIMKTSGSQVDSPVAEGKRTEGGGRKMRDLHRDT